MFSPYPCSFIIKAIKLIWHEFSLIKPILAIPSYLFAAQVAGNGLKEYLLHNLPRNGW